MDLDLVQIKFMKKPFGLDLLASRRRVALRKESVCCLFKILIYDLKRERNVFVYVFCLVVFVVVFFFRSIPVTFVRGGGGKGPPYFETLL